VSFYNLSSPPQQEIPSKEENQDSSYPNDGYSYGRKGGKNVATQINSPAQEENKEEEEEEEEEEQRAALGRGSEGLKLRSDLAPPRDLQDADNNYGTPSIQEDEKITIDYMAKDYTSFRNALLDLIPRKMPQWKDRSEADMGIMLVELFSYIADELSYFQDRVANEAFLRTAKARSSLRNHLRLIDYEMQNGLSANAFIKVEVKEESTAIIPAGFQISTDPDKGLQEKEEGGGVVVFETLEDQFVSGQYNKIPVSSNPRKDHNDNASSSGINTMRSAILEKDVRLKNGQHVLFFQEDASTQVVNRKTIVKLAEDSKIITEQAGGKNNNNTLITWEEDDEFPESLSRWNMQHNVYCCANILRAGHGRTIIRETLKEKDQEVSKFSFVLKESPLTFNSDATGASIRLSSTLKVWVDGELWEETDSLLKCGPFDQKFSISIDDDGYATIYFGNNRFGLKPKEDSLIEAQYRVGNGSVGNVDEYTLTQFRFPHNPGWLVEDVIKTVTKTVTNPLPATGGKDIESIEDARIAGPKSLGSLERAVTLKDYEDLVKREFQNEITNAKARFVYTGSWDTIFVSVDVKEGGRKTAFDGRNGGYYGASALLNKITRYLDRVRMIGYEVQVAEPKYIPIVIEITVFLQKYLDSQTVRARILASLGNKDNLADGTRGLFHPDNFTFGDRVYASKIYESLKKIQEVNYGVITKFRKRHEGETISSKRNVMPSSLGPSKASNVSVIPEDQETQRNLELGYIDVNEDEIITIDTDPLHPDKGILIINFDVGNQNENMNGDNNSADSGSSYALSYPLLEDDNSL